MYDSLISHLRLTTCCRASSVSSFLWHLATILMLVRETGPVWCCCSSCMGEYIYTDL